MQNDVEVELLCQSLRKKFELNLKFKFNSNEAEQTGFVNFIRNEFLGLCCAGNSFDIIKQFIKTVFLLSDYDLLEPNVPFQIIEDLIEISSYSVLEHLLHFLDEKSKVWAAVIKHSILKIKIM